MKSLGWSIALLGAVCCAVSASGQVNELAQIPGAAVDDFTPPPIRGQNADGMRIFIYAGLKTHGPGEHDYPQFLADWSKLLTEHGAVVDGALHAPSGDDLANVDVMIIYKGDAGYMNPSEKAALDEFVRRGGGLVILHDGMCGPRPAEFASYTGGAKRHGEVNFTLATDLTYKVVDKASPIVTGLEGFQLRDEAFFKMTWAENPGIQPLATVTIPDVPTAAGFVGDTVPQVWTYEHTLQGGAPARSFVWMQGHVYENFSRPEVRDMLLRGIAWAGKRPVDELVAYHPPAEPVRNR